MDEQSGSSPIHGEVRELAQQHTKKAVATLVEIMNDQPSGGVFGEGCGSLRSIGSRLGKAGAVDFSVDSKTKL